MGLVPLFSVACDQADQVSDRRLWRASIPEVGLGINTQHRNSLLVDGLAQLLFDELPAPVPGIKNREGVLAFALGGGNRWRHDRQRLLQRTCAPRLQHEYSEERKETQQPQPFSRESVHGCAQLLVVGYIVTAYQPGWGGSD